MEGQKRRLLFQDCRGVSEVYGQLLMMSIVVLAFSMIGLTVFSDHGAVKPEHIPHTDLQENFNISDNKIQIVHSGGEAIDKSAIKIIVSVNGKKEGEFNNVRPIRPDGTEDNVFTLGNYIEISTKKLVTNSTTGQKRDPTSEDMIEMFFIDTPSQQVIQKAILQRGLEKVPDWITPHPYGSVYSGYAETGDWKPTELVAGINDGRLTDSHIPQNAMATENYTFGIDANEMGISNPLNQAQLKIIYQVHGNSPGTLRLRIFNGTEWTQIAPNAKQLTMPEYNSVNGYLKDYPDASLTTYDIISYVNTTSKLEKLQASLSVNGSSTSDRILGVDFVGIHVN